MDVCSIKEHPTRAMKKILPKYVQVLATHPMFGPDSAKDGIKGKKIALCKVRINRSLYVKIKKYLVKHGLRVIETTPEEHDKQIAQSLVLTHFIGRALIEMKLKKIKLDTEGYKRLLHILGVVEHDTWQLFEDMNRYNKYAKNLRKEFVGALDRINKRLDYD